MNGQSNIFKTLDMKLYFLLSVKSHTAISRSALVVSICVEVDTVFRFTTFWARRFDVDVKRLSMSTYVDLISPM